MKLTCPFKQKSRKFLSVIPQSPANQSAIVYSHLHMGSPLSQHKKKAEMGGNSGGTILGPRNFSVAPSFKFDISNESL
jgi:uncharacterized protein YwlG (UPF0340 family)